MYTLNFGLNRIFRKRDRDFSQDGIEPQAF
jgi:hypothetical protein